MSNSSISWVPILTSHFEVIHYHPILSLNIFHISHNNNGWLQNESAVLKHLSHLKWFIILLNKILRLLKVDKCVLQTHFNDNLITLFYNSCQNEVCVKEDINLVCISKLVLTIVLQTYSIKIRCFVPAHGLSFQWLYYFLMAECVLIFPEGCHC